MPNVVKAAANTGALILLLFLVSTVMAGERDGAVERETAPRLPFTLYRTPAAPIAEARDRAKDCLALERELSEQMPLTYSYQPDFYNDPYQGASVWIGTTLFTPAYALSAFSGLARFQENGRIISAQQRIEVLRHLKAQLRCFET